MPKSVTVKKDELLQTLADNRERHRERFIAALNEWKRQGIENLESAVADAKAGKELRLYFNLPRPEDHTDDYDDIIGMLMMDVDDEVTISTEDYRRFVTDNWEWKRQFTATTGAYLTD